MLVEQWYGAGSGEALVAELQLLEMMTKAEHRNVLAKAANGSTYPVVFGASVYPHGAWSFWSGTCLSLVSLTLICLGGAVGLYVNSLGDILWNQKRAAPPIHRHPRAHRRQRRVRRVAWGKLCTAVPVMLWISKLAAVMIMVMAVSQLLYLPSFTRMM